MRALATLRALAILAIAIPLAAGQVLGIAAWRATKAAGQAVAHRAHDALFGYLHRSGLAPGIAQMLALQPFTNVVASGTAITDLRFLFGYSIERLILQLGGTTFTKAMITALQLKANSKVIFDSTGSRTDTRNQYRGITANAAFLTVDFLELRARSKLGLMMGAIDTSLGTKDLRLEVTISGANAPTLVGYAEVSPPQVAPEFQNLRALIARVHGASQTIGASGTFPLSVPHLDPNSGGSIFKRIHCFSANMTGARVERNGIREWEMNTTAANNFIQGEYAKVAQSNLFPIDFVVDNLSEDRVLDTRPGARCTTANVFGTFSAGETITIEAETLEPLDAY